MAPGKGENPKSRLSELEDEMNNLIDDLQESYNLGSSCVSDSTLLSLFKARLSRIDNTYDKFQRVINEYMRLALAGENQDLVDTLTALRTRIRGVFYKTLAFSMTDKEGENRNQTRTDASPVDSIAKIKLPAINIPTFSGEISSWITFKDTFQSLIHSNSKLSSIQKFHYLKSSLKDCAAQTIASISVSSENYSQAWNALIQKYDNKRLQACNLLNKIFSFKPLLKSNHTSLEHFSQVVLESANAFINLKLSDPAGFILYTFGLRLLDAKTRDRFELEHSIGQSEPQEGSVETTIPSFQNFADFIHKQCTMLQSESLINNSGTVETPARIRNKSPKRVFMSSKGSVRSCIICHDKHLLYQCPQFLALTPDQRFQRVKTLRCCVNCLSAYHSTFRCRVNTLCRQCRQKHHSLLHFSDKTHSSNTEPYLKSSPLNDAGPSIQCIENERNNNIRSLTGPKQYPNIENQPSTADVDKTATFTASSAQEVHVLLGTATARLQTVSGLPLAVRILVDCGSQRSFITKSCAQTLGLPIFPNPQGVCGFGDSPIQGGKSQITCTLMPKHSFEPRVKTNAVIVKNITEKLPVQVVPKKIQRQYAGHDLADPHFWKPGQVDFLLGADLFGDIFLGERIDGSDGYPSAFKTIFGWVLMGKMNVDEINSAISLVTVSSFKPTPSLDQIIQKFWEVETVPSVPKINPEDAQCEAHFVANHSRDEYGRYQVRLPFKTDSIQLGDSYSIALKRFRKLEYRLDKIPDLKSEYSNIIKDYIKRNYISPVTQRGEYIIPHHCVTKDSTSTRVRIVFDASSSTERGSLNEKLLVGPKLQLDIQNVILNFRKFRIALTADICQMYLQIVVHPEDRRYLHFLYRFNTVENMNEYEINRVPFGLSCSPFLAIRTVKQLVYDEGSMYPMASRALQNEIYVDDILSGADTLEGAVRLQQELVELLAKGGLTLKKWSSNSKELLAHVSDDSLESPFAFIDNSNPCIKILGMKWDQTLDCIAYNIHVQTTVLTKRGIMSSIARMFDPLGYLAPVIFKAKTILQKLWCLRLDWDELVPENIAEIWNKFSNDLAALSDIRIPRCVFHSKTCHKSIIGFADASELGYAIAIYLRCQYKSGEITTSLLIAKTRLAPLKSLSVPRLELCAAVLLVHTLLSINTFIQDINIDAKFLFSDSSVVLSWLQLPPHTLKTFVANRTVEILEHTNINEWYHVPSSDNAADIASRGLDPSDLVNQSLWWNGPQWLSSPMSLWPISKKNIDPVPEVKSNAITLTTKITTYNWNEVIEKLSSYLGLLRTFAHILRFVHNSKNKSNKYCGPLKLHELNDAKFFLIKSIQAHYFGFDGSLNDSNKSIRCLSPFVDSRGIIRVGGRLTHSPLSTESKYPILLPYKAHFSKLLVEHLHQSYLHAGPQLLYSLIQRSFWIISGRRLVKSCWHNCINCSRLNKKPYTPYMSDLPPSRFEQGRCFINTGVDFAGPFLIKDSKRRKPILSKTYLAIFVCLSTKAIHVEVVSELTTDALLASLDRFIARRGLPSKFLSDNGSNFVGAERHIKDVYEWLSRDPVQKEIYDHLQNKQIMWEFIPPSAPHFGGIWEAGVKSFKLHLYRVLNNRTFTFEEFTTLASRIEAMLNSRPLYPLSNAPDEYDVLTPGHFLIGGPLVSLPEINFHDTPSNRLSRWQFLQQCIQHIWSRWRRDYLNSLQQRYKWNEHSENLSKDTLVLLREPKAAPLHWPTARVVETYPGSDGVVRVVKIRTTKGEYVRPVTKLSPLLPTDAST